MPRRAQEWTPPPDAADAVDVNQIVAYNFRRARELRGMTQDQAAAALEPFTGVRVARLSPPSRSSAIAYSDLPGSPRSAPTRP